MRVWFFTILLKCSDLHLYKILGDRKVTEKEKNPYSKNLDRCFEFHISAQICMGFFLTENFITTIIIFSTNSYHNIDIRVASRQYVNVTYSIVDRVTVRWITAMLRSCKFHPADRYTQPVKLGIRASGRGLVSDKKNHVQGISLEILSDAVQSAMPRETFNVFNDAFHIGNLSCFMHYAELLRKLLVQLKCSMFVINVIILA